MGEKQSNLLVFFGPNFLKEHAGRIMGDPEFALVELVANSWDAGADTVQIEISDKSGGKISIEDNGTGMANVDFMERWRTLNYNRKQAQGIEVKFPDNRKIKRVAYGRNGKGRHAMFCFSDIYFVDTYQNGDKNLFQISKSKEKSLPFEIQLKENQKIDEKLHGTKIFTNMNRNFISERRVIELIGIKFVADPSFKIIVNGKEIPKELLNLLEEEQIGSKFGNIILKLYDSQSTGRTTLQSGIAWRVNKRLVGGSSWKLAKKSFIDGRKSEAKRYIFIVEADFLEDAVLPDWSWFDDENPIFNATFELVSQKIEEKLFKIFLSKRSDRKKTILSKYQLELRQLPILSRERLGAFLDKIQISCPSLNETDLDNLTDTLIKLEGAKTGYELLTKLSQLKPSNLDDLTQLLSTWTITEIKTILDELKWRFKLINELEILVNQKSNELHQLQPIFENALWIFGPEFDSVQYFSNQTLSKIIEKLFGKKLEKPERKRPDFIIIDENSTVKIYSTDEYDAQGEIIGYRKIIILELKRGQFKISRKEIYQAGDYAKKLREQGNLAINTQIISYVLGSYSDPSLEEFYKEGEFTTIFPITYEIVLRKAHSRILNLIQKIETARKNELLDEDEEMKAVLSQKVIDDYNEAK